MAWRAWTEEELRLLGPSPEARETAPAVPSDLEEFVFILDPKLKRRVIVHAPHDLTNKELGRVRKWMDVQSERDEEPSAGIKTLEVDRT